VYGRRKSDIRNLRIFERQVLDRLQRLIIRAKLDHRVVINVTRPSHGSYSVEELQTLTADESSQPRWSNILHVDQALTASKHFDYTLLLLPLILMVGPPRKAGCDHRHSDKKVG